MLHLFRNYNPFTVLILIISCFVMKLQALSSPVTPVALPDHLFFELLLDLLDKVFIGSAFAFTFLAVIMILLQALYLNHITVKYHLFRQNNYFPAFSYLLVTSLAPGFNYFSEPLLINWLMLIGLNLMLSLNQTTQPRKQIYNAGFVICLPMLIQFPAVGFFLLFISGLLLLRSFNAGEWVVGLLGYITPLYFFLGILFLFDRFHLLPQIPEIGFALPAQFDNPLYRTGTVTGLTVLLIVGIISIQGLLPKFTIYIRRSWGVIILYLLIALIVSFVAVSGVNAEWLIMTPPLSLIIANAFLLEKSRVFSNFTFYFSLILLIFCQLALNR